MTVQGSYAEIRVEHNSVIGTLLLQNNIQLHNYIYT